MVREWDEIRGGNVQCEITGSRWAHVSDDSWVIGDFRPFGVGADMCAVSNHAMARTFASGYQKPIFGSAPPVAYWSAITTLEDVIPVMLAVLDRELTGAVACLDWYLQTPCSPRLCPHHPDADGAPFCGSASCADAAPDSPCDCLCGGENHGIGRGALRSPRPEAPDWSTVPALLWQPGFGTVEVDPMHRRIAGRSPFSRHGTRVRAPSSAWTGTVEGALADHS
ncbi:hypothetical protein ASE03_23860 [Kitasatospora sp. Root187]|nr:hypothetical protein ASC99_27735 [Kitasatospora sp. Root107]KRB71600.1 hypothetical protein ASE03_23860 [Kitasatospora sp. Root187]